jgi:hypothetical protein
MLQAIKILPSNFILRDGDVLMVPDLFPGFEVVVADLWSSEFDKPFFFTHCHHLYHHN